MPTGEIKIILFNGPPRSGKDTATDMMLDILRYKGEIVQRYRFATPLKRAIHELFGFSDAPDEHFSSSKEKTAARLFGMSPRQAYIWLSEEVAKPKFGKDFFAKVAVTSISRMRDDFGTRTVVVSDCGFDAELVTLAEAFGPHNIHLVRMYREGSDFKKMGDSRDYVAHPLVMKWVVENNGSIDSLQKKISNIAKEIANEK